MLIPLLVIFWAVVAAGVVAYGGHPSLVLLPHGLGMMLIARRILWPLVVLSILLCLVLVVMVISGRRRVYWLLGLAPVLALFVHKFHSDPMNAFGCIENPLTESAPFQVGVPADTDYVVGVKLGDQAFAYPFYALYRRPVVIQANHEKRMAVMWSAFANHASACMIDRDMKARDLEIVSFPANALLVYNARLGEFINGLTMLRQGVGGGGGKVTGFGAPLPVMKTTWKVWKTLNPETKVMVSEDVGVNDPHLPVLPVYRVPAAKEDEEIAAETRIAFVSTQPPLAVLSDAIPARPLNVVVGGTPVLLWRDPSSGVLKGFDRRVEGDLVPQFKANLDASRAGVVFVDMDSLSGWSAGGVAVDGDPKFKGKKLASVTVEDDVYWGVMKYWYPSLKLHPRAVGAEEPAGYEGRGATGARATTRRGRGR